MKTIKSLLVGLLIPLFFIIVYANRDCVSSVSYSARAHNPLYVIINLDNVATTDKPDYILSGNLFSLADFEVVAGGCSITKYSDYIKVTYSYTKSTYLPESSHTCKIKVEIDKDDLKTYVENHLPAGISDSEKNEILSGITYGLVDSFNAVLKLTTNSNGGSLPDYQVELPSYTLNYEYKYIVDTCSDGIDNDGDGKIDYGIVGSSGDVITPKDPDCTSTCHNEKGCDYPSPISKPACSDGIDNDGDGKIDYPDDPGCSSADDTSEGDYAIQNIHQIPTIGDLTLMDSVTKTNISIPGFISQLIMPADISSYNNLILLGKYQITNNGTSQGIKKIVATVMNAEGTSPLGNNCIYNGEFANPKTAGSYIPLYINAGCDQIRTAGDYSISFQYIDAEGYPSQELRYKLKVIPGQVDPTKVNIQLTKDSSIIYDDAYSFYNSIITLKDKYGNLIKNRNVINKISLSSNLIVYPTEITNISTDSNGQYEFKLYSYTSSGNEINYNFKFNKVKVISTFPYYEIEPNSTIMSNESKDIDFTSIILSTKLLTGSNNSIYGINMDIPLKFRISTANFTNPNPLTNIRIKWIPKVYDTNGNDITDKFNIVASTGYEEDFSKLLNGNLDLPEVGSGSSTERIIKLRLEPKGDIYSDVKLGGTGEIVYDLDGVGGIKTIHKKVNWFSNIELKYWGVYVGGQYSSKTKALYEINRSTAKGNTSTIQLKNKTYNDIVKKVTNIVRGISPYSNNEIDNIDGIYYVKDRNVTIKGEIKKKSLVYVEGGNVFIKGNITKANSNDILTIVVRSDNGEGGYVFIDPSVTQIDAIIVTEKGIYPLGAYNEDINGLKAGYMLEVVKGNKNQELKNQLLIRGLVLSKGNTIGGSFAINGNYVLPNGTKLEVNKFNFYKAAVSDLNYLRRYHIQFNPGNHPDLDQTRYGTYPVVILYDAAIKTSQPYGF